MIPEAEARMITNGKKLLAIINGDDSIIKAAIKVKRAKGADYGAAQSALDTLLSGTTYRRG